MIFTNFPFCGFAEGESWMGALKDNIIRWFGRHFQTPVLHILGDMRTHIPINIERVWQHGGFFGEGTPSFLLVPIVEKNHLHTSKASSRDPNLDKWVKAGYLNHWVILTFQKVTACLLTSALIMQIACTYLFTYFWCIQLTQVNDQQSYNQDTIVWCAQSGKNKERKKKKKPTTKDLFALV